ncbi:fumarate hydratase, class I, anaerobic, putative [Shewanella benthica KT99]|uniref:Fumarate hydratase, class I, anaerobic, putative n=1 Tax=Shewanella benthica KT99 TaxID=314608 RepID=A9DHP2_9GAMM|nr:fumarate hydratase, class I, anaerobic, putative [Shewanella benthica KT99]
MYKEVIVSKEVVIKQADLIESIADSLQYISYYHPKDFVDAMTQAYEREESAAAKDAIAQILINSRMSAEGKETSVPKTRVL